MNVHKFLAHTKHFKNSSFKENFLVYFDEVPKKRAAEAEKSSDTIEEKKIEVKNESAAAQVEASKKPAEVLKKKPLKELLIEAEIEDKNGKYKFNIGDVERNFTKTAKFTKYLKTLKTSDEIKLAVYTQLLEIIQKDKSYYKDQGKYNWHKVADGDNDKFQASNEELEREIERLKVESVAPTQAGGPPTNPSAPKPNEAPPEAEVKPGSFEDLLRKAEVELKREAKKDQYTVTENGQKITFKTTKAFTERLRAVSDASQIQTLIKQELLPRFSIGEMKNLAFLYLRNGEKKEVSLSRDPDFVFEPSDSKPQSGIHDDKNLYIAQNNIISISDGNNRVFDIVINPTTGEFNIVRDNALPHIQEKYKNYQIAIEANNHIRISKGEAVAEKIQVGEGEILIDTPEKLAKWNEEAEAGSKTEKITSAEALEAFLAKPGSSALYISEDWCKICKFTKPLINEISKTSQANFGMLENQATLYKLIEEKLKIKIKTTEMPHIILIKNGKFVADIPDDEASLVWGKADLNRGILLNTVDSEMQLSANIISAFASEKKETATTEPSKKTEAPAPIETAEKDETPPSEESLKKIVTDFTLKTFATIDTNEVELENYIKKELKSDEKATTKEWQILDQFIEKAKEEYRKIPKLKKDGDVLSVTFKDGKERKAQIFISEAYNLKLSEFHEDTLTIDVHGKDGASVGTISIEPSGFFNIATTNVAYDFRITRAKDNEVQIITIIKHEVAEKNQEAAEEKVSFSLRGSTPESRRIVLNFSQNSRFFYFKPVAEYKFKEIKADKNSISIKIKNPDDTLIGVATFHEDKRVTYEMSPGYSMEETAGGSITITKEKTKEEPIADTKTQKPESPTAEEMEKEGVDYGYILSPDGTKLTLILKGKKYNNAINNNAEAKLRLAMLKDGNKYIEFKIGEDTGWFDIDSEDAQLRWSETEHGKKYKIFQDPKTRAITIDKIEQTQEAKTQTPPVAKIETKTPSSPIANIEFKTPKDFTPTPEQAKTLDEVKEAAQKALTEKDNAYDVLDTFKELGEKLQEAFPSGEYELSLKFENTRHPFTWSTNVTENNGFGPTDMTTARRGLRDEILDAKASQTGQESDINLEFRNKTINKVRDLDRKNYDEIRTEKFRTQYKELSSQTYTVDNKFDDLWEGDIEKKWNQVIGHPEVDNVIKGYPFNILGTQIPRVMAKIISEGDNREVNFEDIFKFMGGFPEVAKNLENRFKDKPEFLKEALKLLSDGGKFRKKFEELMDKPHAELSEEEKKLRLFMFDDVIKPCFALLDNLQRVRYPETEAKEMSEEEILHAGLAESENKNLERLKKLFLYTDQPAGVWSRTMNFIAGGETSVTMSRVDGSTFVLDEGVFRRHFTPSAAILGFINRAEPKLYTLENGKKVLDEAKVVAEINRTMKWGVAQLRQQYILKNNETPTGDKYDESNYTITSLKDIGKLTDDQLLVFQLGFINERVNAFEQKVKETPPGLKNILDKFKDLPPKQLDKIKSTLLAVGYLHFHKNGDGSYELKGGGVGAGVDLGDGYTLAMGIGANKTGQGSSEFAAGLVLDIKVYKDAKNLITIPIGISTEGVGAGIAGKHEIAEGWDFSWNLGLALTWKNLIPVQAGVGLSWEGALINHKVKSRSEEAKEQSGLKELWGKWETLNSVDRWELIKTLPVFTKIEEEMKKSPEILTQDSVINMVNLYYEQVKDQDVYDKMMACPFIPVAAYANVGTVIASITAGIVTGGLAALAVAVVGGVKVQIGSVTVFIPHPREEQRLLSEISSANIDAKLKAELLEKAQLELKNIQSGETEISLTENTPDIYYRPGKGLGVRTDSKEVNFKSIGEKIQSTKVEANLSAYNEALKPAEIRLVDQGEATELIIDNDDDKDIEIHIDPTLLKLALVKTDGKILITGDINDLIITRERFEFNHPLTEGGSSMRDEITIRQADSFHGKATRDRLWMEEHEDHFLEKITGQDDYTVQRGLNYAVGNYKGNVYASNFKSALDKEEPKEVTAQYQKFRETSETKVITKGLDKAKVDKYEQDANEMQKAVGAILKSEYNQEKVRDGFFKLIETLFKNPKIKHEFEKESTLYEPSGILPILEKEGNITFTNREANLAISYLFNLHYTTLGTLKHLINVKNYTKSVYFKKFEKLGFEKDMVIKMTERFISDIYDRLIKKFQDPKFNFKTDLKVGHTLQRGDIFVSGTFSTKGKALGRTVNYEETPSTGPHAFGFFEETGRPYNLGSADEVEKNLAQALLELADPLPKLEADPTKTAWEIFGKQDNTSRQNPYNILAIKIVGLKAYRLIVETEEGGEQYYRELTEIVVNPNKAKQYPQTLKRFLDFVKKVRDNTGKIMEFKTADGLKITLDMSETKIVSGSYTKCGNASHAVNEGGKITIERTPEKIVRKPQVMGKMSTINTINEAELSKRFVSVGAFAGFTSTKAEEEKVRGKHSPDTPIKEEAIPDKASGGGPKIDNNGNIYAPDSEGNRTF